MKTVSTVLLASASLFVAAASVVVTSPGPTFTQAGVLSVDG